MSDILLAVIAGGVWVSAMLLTVILLEVMKHAEIE